MKQSKVHVKFSMEDNALNNLFRKLLMCVILFNTYHSFAQYLNQVNVTNNEHEYVEQFNWEGNSLVGAGGMQDTAWMAEGWTKLTFRKYDTSFNVISSTEYGDSVHWYFSGFGFKYLDDAYYLNALKSKASNPDTLQGVIFKFDTLGNVIWEKRYFSNYEEVRLFGLEIKNNLIYVAGAVTGAATGNTSQIHLIELDTAGTVNWTKVFSGNSQSPFGLSNTTDGGFIMSSRYNMGVGNWKTAAYKLDALGNTEWMQLYGGSVNEHRCVFDQMPSGNYLGRGNSQDPLNATARSWLIEIDAAGNVVQDSVFNFSTGFDQFLVTNVEFKPDRMQLVGFGYENISTSLGMAYVASIGYDFTLNWRHEFFQRNSQNAFLFQKPLINGFTMLAGTVLQDDVSNTNDSWFVIIDSLGCDYSNCSLSLEDLTLVGEFLVVHPNPTTSNSILNLNYNDGNYLVRDYFGRKIQVGQIENSQIHLHNLIEGIYLLEYENDGNRKSVRFQIMN